MHHEVAPGQPAKQQPELASQIQRLESLCHVYSGITERIEEICARLRGANEPIAEGRGGVEKPPKEVYRFAGYLGQVEQIAVQMEAMNARLKRLADALDEVA